jgi:DNA-binding beta-propeller fold protein YncE
VRFTPAASTAISLAKFGHQAGGPVGRRLVASPLGTVVYAAGSGGIVRLGAADLAVTGRFLEGVAVDAMAVTPDGSAIYALVHTGGRIVKLDAVSGRIVGEVPGGGFDRLLAVVPW